MSKIGRRILSAIVLVVLISMALTTGAFLWLQLNANIADRKAAIEATGYVYASAIAEHVEAGDRTAILKVLRSITRVPDVSYAVAIDRDGREIAGLGASVVLSGSLTEAGDSPVVILSRGTLPVAVDIVRAGNTVGRLFIVADVSGLRAHLLNAMIGTILAAGFACFIGVLFAFRLQQMIAGPILSLTAAIGRIRTDGDYKTRVNHVADDETGQLVDAFNGMITEIGARGAKLERLAYFDPLTGLPNRQQLQDRIAAVAASRQPNAALILLDIDDFRQINETFGLTFGDAILAGVAAALRRESPEGQFIARVGADQFAVIASGACNDAGAQAALAPLLGAFFKPVNVGGRDVYLSLSAGAAFISADSSGPDEVLRHADLALNSVERIGLGRVQIFRPSLDEDVQTRTALAEDLRRAIANGELEANYQPQVDLRSGAVTGFESLLRWKHPARGYVSPGLFIPIAETSGIVCDLGLWILRESCRQARRWVLAGNPPAQMSVNVSLAQIIQSNFHEDVARVLAETGLPARQLCLELTESLFAGHSRLRAQTVLDALHGQGVTLAIDDFGTGYSSLAYLQDLPFDKLKIDRAFVTDIDTNVDRRRLFRGILDLAHSLNMTVVAEGAETDAEVQTLIDLDVEEVQGYAMARPMRAQDAIAKAAGMAGEFHGRFSAPPARRAVG